MKKRIIYYAILPVMALALMGAGTASAHGWGFGFGSSATPGEIAQRQTQMFQQKADLLGISVDDVKNAWAKGQTMQELATEKGITQEQLQEKMKTAAKQKLSEHMQALVQQGVITQAQADQRLQIMQQKVDSGQKMMMKGLGHGMGMHF